MGLERRHTDREYAAELSALRDQVLFMGARVEDFVTTSLRSFDERDLPLARRLIAQDAQIDELALEIEELCLRILARRQPVASDLRFITTALKLVTDLERIGDLVTNICERVLELNGERTLPLSIPLARIGESVRAMLEDALDAFVDGDAAKAEQVVERDSRVDAYYAQLFPELLAHMTADPGAIGQASRLQAIGKYLERIADHATNIAEMVVFMVRGRSVRTVPPRFSA